VKTFLDAGNVEEFNELDKKAIFVPGLALGGWGPLRAWTLGPRAYAKDWGGVKKT